jgi:hypothetical protein
MARVGVINENENVGEKITKVLSELNITMEGVNTQVANEIEKTADDAVNAPAEEAKTEAVVEEVVVETAEDAPVVEEASEEEAPVEEVETEEAEVTTDDTKINYDAVKALVLDLAAQFNRVEEKLINKYNELETTVTEKLEKAVTEETLTEKLNEVQTLKKELAEAQGTLEKVISATAMSQSEDEDRNETVIEKSNDEDTNSGIFEKGLFTSGFNLA